MEADNAALGQQDDTIRPVLHDAANEVVEREDTLDDDREYHAPHRPADAAHDKDSCRGTSLLSLSNPTSASTQIDQTLSAADQSSIHPVLSPIPSHVAPNLSSQIPAEDCKSMSLSESVFFTPQRIGTWLRKQALAATSGSAILFNGAMRAARATTSYAAFRLIGAANKGRQFPNFISLQVKQTGQRASAGTAVGIFADRYHRRGGALHLLYWYNAAVVTVCVILAICAAAAEILRVFSSYLNAAHICTDKYVPVTHSSMIAPVMGILKHVLCSPELSAAIPAREAGSAESSSTPELFWHSLFWIRTLYGLSAAPYIVFKLPLVARLYLTSHITGYDPLGRTVRFTGKAQGSRE
jgi:hypothetical protein